MDPFRYLLGPDDPRPKGRRRRRVRSFDDFAAEYTAPARAWLVLDGMEEDDAADVVQSALLALWERRAEVPRRAWPMWLLSAILLRRIALYRFRAIRHKHAPRVAWETELDAQGAMADPEEKLGSAEVSIILKELLAGLRPERQAIVQAYLLEELSMEDAAKKLGIALPTAWDRWRRAKQDLLEQVVRRRERERFKAGATSFLVVFFLIERILRWLRGRSERQSRSRPEERESRSRSERQSRSRSERQSRSRSERQSGPCDVRQSCPCDVRQSGPPSDWQLGPRPWAPVVLAVVLAVMSTGHAGPASATVAHMLSRVANAALAGSSRPFPRSILHGLAVSLATSGNRALASSGNRALATSGNRALATSGNRALATAGRGSVLSEAEQGDGEGRPERSFRARMLHVRIAGTAQLLGERGVARSLLKLYEQSFPDRPYAGFHAALARELSAP